jgi:broad specificity phosphatase PhoE
MPVTRTGDGDARRTIFLVRHGRTALNAAGLLRGHLDPPLDEVGQQEASAVAQLFEGVPVSLVLSSPLQRARETAEAIAEMVGAPLRSADAFIDRDYGPWAGVDRAEVEAKYGSLSEAPEVEPFDALVSRTTFELVAQASLVESLLVVAHDIVNRVLLARLATNVSDDPEAIPQRTGCWNQLERQRDGWRAVVVDALPGDGQVPRQAVPSRKQAEGDES